MKGILLAVALCVLVAACGSTRSSPSVLQRFQSLKPGLAGATAGSSRLALDSGRINHAILILRPDLVHRADLVLRRDAVREERTTGNAANVLRPLLRGHTLPAVRVFLRDILSGLTYQWGEADRLVHLADTVWWDTSLSGRQNARAFVQLVRTARWDAQQAAKYTVAAAHLRQRDRRSFRFIPVKSAVRAKQASGFETRSTE